MPDLRTELMKLENLKFDDDAQPNTQEVIVTTAIDPNVSMMYKIWEHVYKHPNCTYRDVCKALNQSQSDVSTRLTQMYNAGKVTRHRTDGLYLWSTTSDSYVRKLPKSYKKRKVKPVAKVVKPIPAAKPKSVTKYDVNDLLSTMSIVEARALYDRLKELFGG
jgi:predicted transcriptional regulator